jgi:hypothetical protein
MDTTRYTCTKESMHMYEGWRYLSISIPHTPKWRGAGRSIRKVFQHASRSKFRVSSSHHPRITRPANHSLLYLTTLQMLGDLHKSQSSSIWNWKYCLFHFVWVRIFSSVCRPDCHLRSSIKDTRCGHRSTYPGLQLRNVNGVTALSVLLSYSLHAAESFLRS